MAGRGRHRRHRRRPQRRHRHAAGYGIRVGYHNHHFVQSIINGRHALDVFADHLAPEVVLEVDAYWAFASGADVPALLGRLGERVVALHVKDGDGSLNTKACRKPRLPPLRLVRR